MASGGLALEFNVTAQCSTSGARAGLLKLRHAIVHTPVFMPVGTQGTLKGILPEQLSDLQCNILLGNTYHLGHRPGHNVVRAAGGLHKFMNWDKAILTDSGGFQMVSLSQLMGVTEEGVEFVSPHTSEKMLLTPEESIRIQNALGADIIMQLDDVVHVSTTGDRLAEAMHRSIRWLDRSTAAHERPNDQALFPIVQGGLDLQLRKISCEEISSRRPLGVAIGGLSGGEDKPDFCTVVSSCARWLPHQLPKYCMGVGYPLDMVVCVAMGVDMFDCVYPTRVWDCPLTDAGPLTLTQNQFSGDGRPIEAHCSCSTCERHSRAYAHAALNKEPHACHLVSLHNVAYQLRLMRRCRRAIEENCFPQFVKQFLDEMFVCSAVPSWAIEALGSAGIVL